MSLLDACYHKDIESVKEELDKGVDINKGDNNVDENRKTFRMEYPKIMEKLKKVIVVRHPMERLVSIYSLVIIPIK